MPKYQSAAIICCAILASCKQPMPGGSIGGGNPYPVSQYSCGDGTRLAVRLFGDRASVSVNGEDPIDLPSKGSEGTTFSDGRRTLAISQGSLSWAVGGAMLVPCSGG